MSWGIALMTIFLLAMVVEAGREAYAPDGWSDAQPFTATPMLPSMAVAAVEVAPARVIAARPERGFWTQRIARSEAAKHVIDVRIRKRR